LRLDRQALTCELPHVLSKSIQVFRNTLQVLASVSETTNKLQESVRRQTTKSIRSNSIRSFRIQIRGTKGVRPITKLKLKTIGASTLAPQRKVSNSCISRCPPAGISRLTTACLRFGRRGIGMSLAAEEALKESGLASERARAARTPGEIPDVSER